VTTYDSHTPSDPYKVLKVGDNEAIKGDPLKVVEEELKDIKYVNVPGIPSFTGKCTMV
jgi:anthranilate synthase component 1